MNRLSTIITVGTVVAVFLQMGVPIINSTILRTENVIPFTNYSTGAGLPNPIKAYYFYERWNVTANDYLTGDVNDDGQMEVITIEDYRLLKILDIDGHVIASKSFTRVTYLNLIEDVTGDNASEIIVSDQGDNYSSVSFYNGNLNLIKGFEVANGTDLDGNGFWDGGGWVVGCPDLDENGFRDVVVDVNTPSDVFPRGLFVFNYTTEALEWSYLTGPDIETVVISDIDNTGDMEIIAGSYALGNDGVNETDYYSYMYAVDSNGSELWINLMGGLYTGIDTIVGDLDGDFIQEIVACTRTAWQFRSDYGWIYIVDSLTGAIEESYLTEYSIENVRIADLDNDGDFEIISDGREGILRIFNETLALNKSLAFDAPVRIMYIGDIEKDDYKEVSIATGEDILLLDYNLNALWKSKAGNFISTDSTICDFLVDTANLDEMFLRDGNMLTLSSLSPLKIEITVSPTTVIQRPGNGTLILKIINVCNETVQNVNIDLGLPLAWMLNSSDIAAIGNIVSGDSKEWRASISISGNASIGFNKITAFINSSVGMTSIYETTVLVAGGTWWNPNWGYRSFIAVDSNNYARTNCPVAYDINYTNELGSLGESGTFDVNSVRVIEYGTSGEIVTEESCVFRPVDGFNKNSNANGTVFWTLTGSTPEYSYRYYYLYFDVERHGLKVPPAYNLPPYTLQNPISILSYPGSGSFVTTGDFNNDTRPDIIFTSYDDHAISVLYNVNIYQTNKGFYEEVLAYLNSTEKITSVASGDFDGDKIDDVAFGTNKSRIFVFYGSDNGINSYTGLSGFPQPIVGPMCSGDVERDGQDDIHLATSGSESYSILWSFYDDLGSYTGDSIEPPVSSSNQKITAMATGNFDGDGYLDLAFGTSPDGLIYVLYGTLSGLETPTGTKLNLDTIGDSVLSITINDFNNDGLSDLVALVPSASNNLLYVLYGEFGSHDTLPNQDLISIPINITNVVDGEFNNDGCIDLFLVSDNGDNYIVFGSPNGFNGDLIDMAEVSLTISSIARKDFNGDRNDDVVLTSGDSNTLYISYGYPLYADFKNSYDPLLVFNGQTEQNLAPVALAIPDQRLNEGEKLKSAFNLDSYFVDPEGGELSYTYQDNVYVNVTIDSNNFVSFSLNNTDWHGEENITFIAKDSLNNTASSVVRVIVDEVDDPPVFLDLPAANVKEDDYRNKSNWLSLTSYIYDSDTPLGDLTIVSDNPYVTIYNNNHTLFLNYSGDIKFSTDEIILILSDGYSEVVDSLHVNVMLVDDWPIILNNFESQIYEEDHDPWYVPLLPYEFDEESPPDELYWDYDKSTVDEYLLTIEIDEKRLWFHPISDTSGAIDIQINLTDNSGNGHTVSKRIHVELESVNDLPAFENYSELQRELSGLLYKKAKQIDLSKYISDIETNATDLEVEITIENDIGNVTKDGLNFTLIPYKNGLLTITILDKDGGQRTAEFYVSGQRDTSDDWLLPFALGFIPFLISVIITFYLSWRSNKIISEYSAGISDTIETSNSKSKEEIIKEVKTLEEKLEKKKKRSKKRGKKKKKR